MKKLILSILLTVIFLFSTAAAQNAPVEITGGSILIDYSSEQVAPNTRIETANFTATGNLGGLYSPWSSICELPSCRLGTTFAVIPYPRIDLGGCIGSCYQFTGGTFIQNGTTYEHAWYKGYFDFSRAEFQIPRFVRRKGSMRFTKPFSMTGHLQVCKVTNIDRACPADKILFEGEIKGEGILTVSKKIKVYDNGSSSIPYLHRWKFEYQFQP